MNAEGLGKFSWLTAIAFLVCTLAIAAAKPAYAAERWTRVHHVEHRHYHVIRHPVPLYHAELLEDAETGQVLLSKNADLEWPPASLTKLMLLLITTKEIEAGRLSYDTPVQISRLAAYTGGSRLGIMRPGEVFPLGQLMKAAMIDSANDAAVAIAQKIAGSIPNCVRMMNEEARELGLTETHYGTVNGLPPIPDHDVDRTSARDLAKLARIIIYHTQLMRWSRLRTAPFDHGVAELHNTNHLLGKFPGCDGLKTGFTFKAGFNLTATAKRGDIRLISVVLGAPSNPERFIQSAKLLDWGFDHFEKVQVLRRGQPLPVHVQVAAGPYFQPVSNRNVALLVRKSDPSTVRLEYHVPTMVSGPVNPGEPVGRVVVLNDGDIVANVSAICPLDDNSLKFLRTPPADPPAPNGTPTDGLSITNSSNSQMQEKR